MTLHPSARTVIERRRASLRPLGAEPTWDERRSAFTATWREAGPADVAVEDRVAQGRNGEIPLRLYRSETTGGGERPAIICLHGGGFVFGGIESYDPQARRWAESTGAVVVNVDYRLAPQHPFPAGAFDVLDAYDWIVSNATELGIDPTRIAAGGDSAGANLTMALATQLRARGGVNLAGMVLLCPTLDPDAAAPSDLLPEFRSGGDWWWNLYLASNADRHNPLAAPLHGSVESLPPTLLMTAKYDDLCPQGIELAERLRTAGNNLQHVHYDDMFHVFHMYPESIEAARTAQQTIGAFFDRTLNLA